jgi:hypothetical protein
MKSKWGGMMAKLPAKPSGSPFYKQKRYSHQQEADQIRDDKCTATILYCLHGETQKIPKPDRIASHCQD